MQHTCLIFALTLIAIIQRGYRVWAPVCSGLCRGGSNPFIVETCKVLQRPIAGRSIIINFI